MGRWIDADVYEKFIKAKYADREKAEDIKEQMLFDLSCQPTAYDVDAVVQQLEDRKSLMLETLKISEADIDRGRIYGMDKAIEIVKNGGRE